MLTPGELIDGRYRIGDLLGRGGMAEVYRATDLVDGRAYAMKAMRGPDTGLEDRFRREAEALARLDHPGLIRLHCAGAHRGVGYLVLDLAEGPPLSRALTGGPAGLERTVSVGQQVAGALAHVHRAGLVHRDVKPSNILVHRDRALLADFGIARLPGAPSLTLTGQVVGSAPYLAPEQVEGEPAGPPADVYALGLVLIECLTGHRCFPGTYVESAIARLHHGPEIPATPAWLHDVLMAMTARDPSRRPSAEAVAEALARRDVAPVLDATAPLVAVGASSRRPAPRRHAGLKASAAAAAVLVTLGWTVLGGEPRPQPASSDPVPTPTTTVVPVAAPAGATGDQASGPAGASSFEGHTHRSPAPAAAPDGPSSAPPAADLSAAAVRPAAVDTGPPPAATDDPTGPAPPASVIPTTTTTAPPPAGGGDDSGTGDDDGSGDGTGSGGEGTGPDVSVPGTSDPPASGG